MIPPAPNSILAFITDYFCFGYLYGIYTVSTLYFLRRFILTYRKQKGKSNGHAMR